MKNEFKEQGVIFQKGKRLTDGGHSLSPLVRGTIATHQRLLRGIVGYVQKGGGRFAKTFAGRREVTRLQDGTIITTWVNPFGLVPILMSNVIVPLIEVLEEVLEKCLPFGFTFNGGSSFLSIEGDKTSHTPPLLAGNRDWISLDEKVQISWDGRGKIRYFPSPSATPAGSVFLYCNGDYIFDSAGVPVQAPDQVAGAAYDTAFNLLYVAIHNFISGNGQSLQIYKAPGTVSENCTVTTTGAFELIDNLHWRTSDSDPSCTGPVLFNASATRFAFTTIHPTYRAGRDLWEGSVSPSAASVAMYLQHTDMESVTFTVRQVTTYSFATLSTYNFTRTDTMVPAPTTDGVYYYCCDYKGDVLVYATIEQDKPTLHNGAQRTSSASWDTVGEKGSSTSSSPFDSSTFIDVPRKLVFHGSNIDSFYYLGMFTNTRSGNMSASYTNDAADSMCVNITNGKMESISYCLLLALDLRVDFIAFFLEHSEVGAGTRNDDYMTTHVFYNGSKVTNEIRSTPAILPAITGCIFWRAEYGEDSDVTSSSVISFDLAKARGPDIAQGGLMQYGFASVYPSNSYMAKFALVDYFLGTLWDYEEIILHGVSQAVTDDITDPKASRLQ